MKVIIDETAGFCWGVVRTLENVERILDENKGENIYVLGQIIHNPKEIERLENIGLKTISHEDLPRVSKENAVVIIRAHGEPPSTYKLAEDLGIKLVDATCPLVKRLQERIYQRYTNGWNIIIYGKKEHSEVIGLRGVCNDDCRVIRTLEEARELELKDRTVLFSQTTMDKDLFSEIEEELKKKADADADLVFEAKNTICSYVSNRLGNLQRFGEANEVVIFVAGRNSSNGKILYNVCKGVNEATHFIEDIEEIDYSWFDGAKTIGITGATSTPQWFMRVVKDEIEKRLGN